MARTIASKANTDAPAYPYTWGKIRDNPGNNTGTAVNEATCGDQHQFFDGLLSIGSITPNNLPENALNGFQYMYALLNIPKKQNDFFHKIGDPFQPSFQNSFTSSAYNAVNGANYKYGDRVDRVFLQGAFERATESNNTTIWIMPIGYRPVYNKVLPILMHNNGTFVPGVLKINASSGAVSVECNAGDGATTAIYIIDGLAYDLN